MHTLEDRLAKPLDLAGLRTIASPSRNVVVQPRAFQGALRESLQSLTHALPARAVPTVHVSTPADLARLFEPIPAGWLRTWLEADVAGLVDAYRALTGDQRPRARLGVVSRDACRKFHVDQVSLRMLCTYAGPGTELLQRDLVDRSLLKTVAPLQAFNDVVTEAAGGARRAQVGDVVLLKGELWPGNTGRGAVHRSPGIASSGQLRLVLKIDAEARKRDCVPTVPALPA